MNVCGITYSGVAPSTWLAYGGLAYGALTRSRAHALTPAS